MAFYKEDIVDIDLNSGKIHRSFLNHTIGHNDKNANRFGVRVFRAGYPVDVSGATVTGYFTDSAGTRTVISNGNYAGGNIAYVTLPDDCYEVNGQFTLAIRLTEDGVTSTLRIVDGTIVDTYTTE
jgi:hypothetical protein